MAKQTKSVKVDDVDYEMTQLGGVEGLDLFDRLTERLGPALAGAIRGLVASGKLDDAGAQAGLGFLLMEAMATLPTAFKLELRVRFAALSKVKAGGIELALGDGKTLEPDGIFDQHFAGRFGHMTRWLLASLKWSFADFLPKSADSKGQPPAATK